MKKILLIILACVAVAFGYVWLSAEKEVATSDSVEYKLKEEGLVFSYKNGADGFFLEDKKGESDVTSKPKLVREVILTPTADYEDQKTRVGGEGSPTWNISVYENSLKQSSTLLVDANPRISNINQIIGSSKDTVFAGANAVTYLADGLYPTKMTVVANGNYVFVISGSYLDENSMTYKHYEEWINSFKFVPSE